jgi:aspartate/methionine/tyrosine aminotransferase
MIPKLSSRTAWDLRENALHEQVLQIRQSVAHLVDLGASNPTVVGLETPRELPLLLADPAAATYDPDPRGLSSAREAVARYVGEHGAAVDPDDIVLTASTSEAYGFLWKLLTDPGDEILVPTPSYPLFGYLAGLEHVATRTYPLVRDEGYRVDLAALEAAVTERTRAVVCVHPNNPTGTLVRDEDARAIAALARARGLAIVADEVFLDFLHDGRPRARSFASETEALTFTLSGLSKACCAPQLKLGWIVVGGPPELRRAALERLVVIADTYLSVSTPVQRALPRILERRPAIAAELSARLGANLAALDRAIASLGADTPLRRVSSDGGWSALVEVPRVMSEDEWIVTFAREAGVLVQPGWFFDIEDGGTLAMSLIVEPRSFEAAAGRIADVVRRHV